VDSDHQAALAEEAARARKLRILVDFTVALIQQERPPRAEAERIVAAAKRQALAWFPDKEFTWDLVLAPRFRRVIDEFAMEESVAPSRRSMS
jgi:hypothetical protein